MKKGVKVNIQNNSWNILTLPFGDEMNDALRQQHHAAQFIALSGRHLIAQQPDDSNTNMQYLFGKEILAGNELPNGFRLGLQLNALELVLLDGELNQVSKISLNGKTIRQAFEELKKKLKNSGIDVSKLNDDLHYEIPAHSVANGSAFQTKGHSFFKENTLQRHNAELILNSVIADYEDAEPVRVWPHHFDSGTIIPLTYNARGKLSRSLGLGWAIPDSMMNEPYYYLSLWSEQTLAHFQELPAPEAGKWISAGWTGGVLGLSDILMEKSAKAQRDKVNLFFLSGMQILHDFLKTHP